MERNDQDLAFMLKYENVAWYDRSAACVRILDRRVYPAQIRYVECTDYRQVISAIRDMVTQSGGPYIAAAMAMALAARQDTQAGCGRRRFWGQNRRRRARTFPRQAHHYGKNGPHHPAMRRGGQGRHGGGRSPGRGCLFAQYRRDK